MIELNIKRLITLRGYEDAVSFLESAGFQGYTARRMLANKEYKLTMKQLEHLCHALKCTPNDLFHYTPEKNANENEPLRALCHQDISFFEQIRSMSLEEIAAVHKMIQEKKG